MPGTTQAENLRVINETRTAFGGVEEAIKNLKRVQTISQAVKIATGGKVEVPAEELGQAFSKILEMRGAAMDDAEFQRQGDAMVRAIVGTSGRLTPQKYLAAGQAAGRGTLSNLSTRYMTEVWPTLLGDTNSPETVGTAQKGLRQIFMGHLSSKTQGEEWAKLIPGFDQTKLHLKGMTPGWEVGAIPDQKLAMTDPDLWINKYVLGIGSNGEYLKDSAAARSGININDQLQVSQLLGRLAPKVGGGNSMLEALAQSKSRQQLEADAPQYREAHDADQIVSDHATADASQAVKNVNTSVEDLFSTLTGGMMPGIANGLDTLTGAIRRLNEASEQSPAMRLGLDFGLGAAGVTATGASALAGKWAFGRMFGKGASEAPEIASATALDGSAAALQGSAGAIDAAAGRLGMGGTVNAAEGAGPGALGLAGITAGGLAASVAAVAAPLALAIVAGKYDQQKREDTAKTWDTPQAKALPNLDDQTFLQRLWGTVPGHATGGLVTGPGGPREDRVLRRLSPGEFVVNAAATARHRYLLDLINGGNINVPGLANGGPVGLSGASLGRVALATDSTSAAMLREVMSGAVYDALRRIRGEGGLDGGGSSGTGAGDGGGTPDLRYGRGGSGRYRGTPGTGQDYETGPKVSLGKMGAKFAAKAPVIMDGLMKKYGLSREQAAGIVGNLAHESAGFTAYHEGGQAPGRGGVGWAQWTGPRRRKFEAWTKAHGLNPTSDEASWRYLTEGDPETAAAIAAVKGQRTVHGASHAWEQSFERAGIKAYGSRDRFADRAFSMRPAGAAIADAPTASDYPNESHRAGRFNPSIMLRSPSAGGSGPQAMNAGVDFDHSGLDAAIAKVDTLHAKLKGLKATASIDINHHHKGDAGARPGALRTSLNGGYASDGRAWT